MLLAPKYRGTELPVHDPETPIMDNGRIRWPGMLEEIAASNDGRFVRTAAITLPGLEGDPHGIDKLLERTDEELDLVAELCGAIVVKHEWGLYPVNSHTLTLRSYLPDESLRDRLRLPENHILVAEVEHIKGVSANHIPDRLGVMERLDHPLTAGLTAGLGQYWKRGTKEDLYLTDMRKAQFIHGVPSQSDGEEQFWLVDIDPRFKPLIY